MESRTPGPEVLGREVIAHRFAQIIIDLAGIDRTAAAVVRDVLEQMLARQFLAMADEANDASVVDTQFVLNAALASKMEDRAPVAHECDMTIAQRRQPEALVFARVFHVADASTGGVEQR